GPVIPAAPAAAVDSAAQNGGGTMVAVRKRAVAAAVESPVAVTTTTSAHAVRLGIASLLPATLRTAAIALRRNKMRSALTALGVIIGVGAVIAMVEISQGSRTSIMQTMATMGANTIMVRSGAAASGGISFGSGTLLTLTPGDAEEIERE